MKVSSLYSSLKTLHFLPLRFSKWCSKRNIHFQQKSSFFKQFNFFATLKTLPFFSILRQTQRVPRIKYDWGCCKWSNTPPQKKRILSSTIKRYLIRSLLTRHNCFWRNLQKEKMWEGSSFTKFFANISTRKKQKTCVIFAFGFQLPVSVHCPVKSNVQVRLISKKNKNVPAFHSCNDKDDFFCNCGHLFRFRISEKIIEAVMFAPKILVVASMSTSKGKQSRSRDRNHFLKSRSRSKSVSKTKSRSKSKSV